MQNPNELQDNLNANHITEIPDTPVFSETRDKIEDESRDIKTAPICPYCQSKDTVRRGLRKNQTDAERILWNALRNRQLYGMKFRRQYSIGNYILDFYSPEYKLGIEADGGQHYVNDVKKQDESRTKELAKIGVQILRFSNIDILNNIEGVCEAIEKTLTLILSLKKGEEKCCLKESAKTWKCNVRQPQITSDNIR